MPCCKCHVLSVYCVAMQLCRGPLPDGHPMPDVLYFSVDQDVAAQACNLSSVPTVEPLRHTTRACVLLDAHRTPDAWYAVACTMPNIIVQGDPDACRPRACMTFATELQKLSIPPAVPLRLHVHYVRVRVGTAYETPVRVSGGWSRQPGFSVTKCSTLVFQAH